MIFRNKSNKSANDSEPKKSFSLHLAQVKKEHKLNYTPHIQDIPCDK